MRARKKAAACDEAKERGGGGIYTQLDCFAFDYNSAEEDKLLLLQQQNSYVESQLMKNSSHFPPPTPLKK